MQTSFLVLFALTYSIVAQIDLPQSYIYISDIGYYFDPKQNDEWLNEMFLDSFEECNRQCNQDPLCRVFDYNYSPKECRLFQVEPSPEQIIYDPLSASQIGIVELFSDLYSDFNKTCDHCSQKRYLTCIDDICQCPWNTFWDGSICQKKKYGGSLCTTDDECYLYIYNLTCVSASVCTSAGYPSNVCGLNRNLVLFNYTTNGFQSYKLYSFSFQAITTSATVTFSLKDKSAYWFLDNITLFDVNTSLQLIENGDFSTGSLTNWNYCNPNSTNHSSKVGLGQYFYSGGPYPYPDFLSQTVSTIIGNLYTFAFMLEHTVGSSQNAFIATIFS